MNWAPAGIPPRELRDVYLHPFEAAVRDRRRSLGDERLQRDRRHSLRRRSRAPDGTTAGRRGDSTASSRPTTSRSGSSPTITGSRRTGRAPRRWRSTAGLDVELPATDCYGAPLLRAIGAGLLAEETRRRGGAAGAEREVRPRASSTSRTSTSRLRRLQQRRRLTASSPGRSPARASCCCATTGFCRCAADVAVDRRDRSERGHGLAISSATTAYPAHVESLRNVLDSGRSSLLDRRCGAGGDRARSPIESPSVLDALRARHGSEVSFARGCDVSRLVRRRFRRSGRAGRRRRRRGAGHGRQVGAHRGLHERRDPRPGVVRSAGRPGGARPRRAGDGHAGRAGARGGAPVGERVDPRALRGGRAWRGCPARRARRDRRRPERRRRIPAGSSPSPIRGRGPGARLLRAQGLGRAVALESATTSTSPASALYPFGHGLGYTTFELSDLRIADGDGALGRRDRSSRRG